MLCHAVPCRAMCLLFRTHQNRKTSMGMHACMLACGDRVVLLEGACLTPPASASRLFCTYMFGPSVPFRSSPSTTTTGGTARWREAPCNTPGIYRTTYRYITLLKVLGWYVPGLSKLPLRNRLPSLLAGPFVRVFCLLPFSWHSRCFLPFFFFRFVCACVLRVRHRG